MLTRRRLICISAAALAAPAVLRAGAATAPLLTDRELAAAEKASGGRLGLAALDVETGRSARWRAEERFAMASTFKAPLVADTLARVDRGEEDLSRPVTIREDDLVPWSPALEPRVGEAMTVAQLCEAAITVSDNAAANLLLAALGGADRFTAARRAMGDPATRLDRVEPDLNEAAPDDPRDTTSPAAMLDWMSAVFAGDALSEESRARLFDWMEASRTGLARLRSGLPRDWRAGDKTGTTRSGLVADLAVAAPSGRRPLLIAVYLAETTGEREAAEAIHAALAREIVAALGAPAG
ncbi:MAG: class A beta-lactamase [Pseudomonadota bacterium]